jgi:hypothetical protein
MPDVNIIGLLEDFYGETLEPGHEASFYDFSPKRADALFDRYKLVTEAREFTFNHTTLSRTNLLLVNQISPKTSHSIGGYHVVRQDEDIGYHNEPLQPLPGRRAAQRAIRRLMDSMERRYKAGEREKDPYDIQHEVRGRRVENLKTLLLIAPSVTIPDQLWMLSAEQMIQSGANYTQDRIKELARRWASYVNFLTVIKPLVTQGAIRIISARRMSETVQYNDTDEHPDEDLRRKLSSKFFRDPEGIFVEQTIKYTMSLMDYKCAGFYEREEHVKVHQAILTERYRRLNRAARTSFQPTPAVFSGNLAKAAAKLSIADLTEVRLSERRLRTWFDCYEHALAAPDEAGFDDRMKEGFENLGRLSSRIVDDGPRVGITFAKNFAAKSLIAAALASMGWPGLLASFVGGAAGKTIEPFVAELTGDAKENDLEARAKLALESHFLAFGVGQTRQPPSE